MNGLSSFLDLARDLFSKSFLKLPSLGQVTFTALTGMSQVSSVSSVLGSYTRLALISAWLGDCQESLGSRCSGRQWQTTS